MSAESANVFQSYALIDQKKLHLVLLVLHLGLTSHPYIWSSRSSLRQNDDSLGLFILFMQRLILCAKKVQKQVMLYKLKRLNNVSI